MRINGGSSVRALPGYWDRLDGGMGKKAQQAQIDRFRDGSCGGSSGGSIPVFLISLRAGGTGLNLPSASIVVLVRAHA